MMELIQTICGAFLIVVLVQRTKCSCEKSYMVICDKLSDVMQYDDTENWEELQIQPQLCEYGKRFIMDEFYFPGNFSKLRRLVIRQQLKDFATYPTALDVESLTDIFLIDNHIEKLRSEIFYLSFDVNIIYLKNNKIKHIQPRAFRDITINLLDLSYNDVTELHSSLFYDCDIFTLIITHNQIDFVEPYSFPDSVKYLHLDHNNLNLGEEEDVFSNCENLTEVTISYNKLTNMIVLAGLTSLEKLDVSYNYISTIYEDEFKNLTKLKYLNLAGNKFAEIDLTYFDTPTRGLFAVSLAHNQFQYLDLSELNRTVETVFTLTLFGNPWNCVCLQEMETIMKDLSDKVTRSRCDIQAFSSGEGPICLPSKQCETEPQSDTPYEAFLTKRRCSYKELVS